MPGDSRLRGFWAEPKWSTYVPFPSSQDPPLPILGAVRILKLELGRTQEKGASGDK